MSLNILWFLFVAVLFCVYFVLDGTDFGVGMLFPFAGKRDHAKQQQMLYAIGPTWGASEVWLITAGGAMFAAFPGWYATIFSGFYPAMFLILAGLIARGVGIEFYERAQTEKGRGRSVAAIFFGSLVPPLILGVAFGNFLQGGPIDEAGIFRGTLLDLFSPFTLATGLFAVVFFLYHGACFLDLKTGGSLHAVEQYGKKLGGASVILLVLIVITATIGPVAAPPVTMALCAVALLALVLSFVMRNKKGSQVLLLNVLVIAAALSATFVGMFPNLMGSTIDPSYSLTIYNSSSSPYTLKIMTIVTCLALPVVIGYTIWAHWVFRKLALHTGAENDQQESVY